VEFSAAQDKLGGPMPRHGIRLAPFKPTSSVIRSNLHRIHIDSAELGEAAAATRMVEKLRGR